MCDPVSAAIGVVGGLVASKALTPKVPTSSVTPTTDPAAERAASEAEAQQSANRRLAEDQRRRRQQGSLLAQGAPSPSLGDSTSADGQNPIGSTAPRVSRSPLSPARLRASLMSAGASPAAAAPSPLGGVGGGGGSGSRTFVQAY